MANVQFSIECEMNERWVPQFLGALKEMQRLGNIGSSRVVSIYADGDGDFQPRFTWPGDLPEPVEPQRTASGDTLFDAG